jgi:hypothetical protein
MKKFYYRNGEEVKAGDICFYTEDSVVKGEDFHYANAILEIVENLGGLYSKYLYSTDNDGLTLTPTEDIHVSLQYCCGYGKESNVLQHFIKLETFVDDSKWVNENFGRKNQKKKINKFIKENLLKYPYKNLEIKK